MTGHDLEPLLYWPHDEARYEELSRRTAAALEALGPALQRLAAAPLSGGSRDGRVTVRVTGSGVVTDVRLRGGVLHHYNHVRLGEVVTRTLRATQQRAREAYEQAAAAITPPEVAECEDLLRRARR